MLILAQMGPYPPPLLPCRSRPRSTALRLTQGHTGGAAAPRWARGRRRGAGAAALPIRLLRGRRQKAVCISYPPPCGRGILTVDSIPHQN
jgi:hypothetical protein